MKKIIKVEGMHCVSCAKIIEMEFEDKANSISVDADKGSVEIDFDEKNISEKQIKEIISKLGYKIKK